MQEFMNTFWEKKEQLMSLTIDHIELTLLAVMLSVAIGMPLGILITKNKKLANVVIGIANLIQAIPSLAILGFLVPVIGIGATPAIIMVILYSMLPILKNTYTALINISPETIEAAKGIGMTQRQILFKVKIPLAIPVIMAGIRIASVTAVGLMTIAAFIGAGGLGYLVFTGIQTVDNNIILLGAIPAAILALLMDFVVGKIEEAITPNGIKSADGKIIVKKRDNYIRNKVIKYTAFILMIALVSGYLYRGLSKKETVVFASKNFSESILLINMLEDLVEGNSSLEVETKLNLGGTSVVFEAMKSGDVDLSVDYTGTMLMSILNDEGTYETIDEVYEKVRNDYSEKFGFDVLDPLGFNNTYAFAVSKEIEEKYGLKKISDLTDISNELDIATTIEFTNRPDGYDGIVNEYGLNFNDHKAIDGALKYKALDSKHVDVIDVFTTDGLIKEFNLTILEDDRVYFPKYYAVPVIREDTLEKYPEIEEAIALLTGKLTDDIMVELNYKIDVEKQDPAKVANDFLIKEELINK